MDGEAKVEIHIVTYILVKWAKINLTFHYLKLRLKIPPRSTIFELLNFKHRPRPQKRFYSPLGANVIFFPVYIYIVKRPDL